MINELFFYYYFLWNWVMIIFYKDNWLPNHIDSLGQRFNSGIIQDLGECKFCMNFWTSSIFAIVITLYTWDYNYLFWGIYACTLNDLIKR